MTELRTWRRRHANGDTSEVTSVPGIGTWESCVRAAGAAGRQWVGQHFSLLTEAQEAADRLAQSLAPHNCSGCEGWGPIERRPAGRQGLQKTKG
jgi:hypothetical protein